MDFSDTLYVWHKTLTDLEEEEELRAVGAGGNFAKPCDARPALGWEEDRARRVGEREGYGMFLGP
jgi:ATP-dependent protease HslVU (ClpYQ) peptidase subunit